MANDPTFFGEVIRAIFRSKKEQSLTEEPSEQKKNIAHNAYQLLRNWRNPPGTKEDGSFDDNTLATWLLDVKILSPETGHLEVALVMFGHVLAYAPADPDGLWIRHSVAKVLNAKDADKIREGLPAELFNSRGVFTWTAGHGELELAAKYRDQADKVEGSGYHRLAGSLRIIASTYERDAERESSRDPFED